VYGTICRHAYLGTYSLPVQHGTHRHDIPPYVYLLSFFNLVLLSTSEVNIMSVNFNVAPLHFVHVLVCWYCYVL
jgi:hypothetical protein